MSNLDLDRPSTPFAKLLAFAETRAPAGLVPVLAQARRDVAIVEGRLLRGEKPSPLVARRSTKSKQEAVKPAAVAAAVAPVAKVRSKTVSLVTIQDSGREHHFEVEQGNLLLEAALASGASLPFSCTLGGCGTCKVHLVAGEIEMEEPNCLTPEEIASGLRLVCVGRATSPECVVRVEREPA